MLSFTRLSAIVIASMFVSQNAGAVELDWELLAAKSVGKGVSCSENTTQLASAGQDAGLFFSKMNIDMPANANVGTNLQFGTCYVFLKFTVPQGYSVSSSQAGVLGGVIKDVGASGYVDVVSTITRRPADPVKPFVGMAPFGPLIHLFKAFTAVTAVNNPLFELTKTSPLTKHQKNVVCGLTKNGPTDLGMFVQISLAGTRKNSSKTNIIAIDNFDSHVGLGLKEDLCTGH
jgi:hypothetical protein